MNDLTIDMKDNQTVFAPGEQVSGEVSWQSDRPPKTLTITLLWQTTARGKTDTEVVETEQIEQPLPQGQAQFRFTLPEGPYSLKGKMIQLAWAIEASLRPGDLAQRVELVVSPSGAEVTLGTVKP